MAESVPAPATTASVASASSIPFRHDGGGGYASGGTSLLLAALLLATAFAVLWWLKRRGWNGQSMSGPTAQGQGLAVVQRLRLSATCSAYVLHDGGERLLVVESRHGVQVQVLPGASEDRR